jgi:hypothetical protein
MSERWTEADVIAHMVKHGFTAPPPLPTATPEGELLHAIRRMAHPLGWSSYHTHDSRKSESGFPDLVLTDGTSLLMYELKTNTGKPTEEQATWLHLLAHTGKVECGIWRPSQWAEISERLTRKKQ